MSVEKIVKRDPNYEHISLCNSLYIIKVRLMFAINLEKLSFLFSYMFLQDILEGVTESLDSLPPVSSLLTGVISKKPKILW